MPKLLMIVVMFSVIACTLFFVLSVRVTHLMTTFSSGKTEPTQPDGGEETTTTEPPVEPEETTPEEEPDPPEGRREGNQESVSLHKHSTRPKLPDERGEGGATITTEPVELEESALEGTTPEEPPEGRRAGIQSRDTAVKEYLYNRLRYGRANDLHRINEIPNARTSKPDESVKLTGLNNTLLSADAKRTESTEVNRTAITEANWIIIT